MTLNICIVGCGARGIAHAQDWLKMPGVKIVAVSDTDADRAQTLADAVGAETYTDWQQAILHDGVTIVSQCVPSFLHADVTCFAAKHGRHVIGEKPLALTLAQGQQIVDTVAETGICFMPAFQYRDRWQCQQYRQAYVDGILGSPLTFRFSSIMEVRPKVAMHHRGMNGGVLIDMACHLVDLLRWITEEEPKSVFASGQVFGMGKARLANINDLAIDEAGVLVQFSGGHKLQLYLNWGMPEGFRAVNENQLIGPNAMLQIKGSDVTLHNQADVETWMPPKDWQEPGMTVRMKRFIEAIQSGNAADITAENGLIALRVSWAALESIETGNVVQL